MDMEFLQQFAPEGVWAVLSVCLVFYIIKGQEKRDLRQDERDKNYQKIIMDLSDALDSVKEIKTLLIDFANEKISKP